MKKIFLAVIFLFCICSVGYAAETVEGSKSVPWYLGEAFLGLVAAVFGAIWTVVKVWILRRNKKLETLTRIAESVLTEIYQREVRALKAAATDGKLSKEEIQNLQAEAWAAIKSQAKAQGLEVAKYIAEEYAAAWIAKLVQKLKGGANP